MLCQSLRRCCLQDGATGDDCLFAASATGDGGVVVGGHSNGTYNGVASEGLGDFAAIKLGMLVKLPCFVQPMLPTMAMAAATSGSSAESLKIN